MIQIKMGCWIASAVDKHIQQLFCQQNHKGITEVGECVGVAAHKDIADNLHVRHDPDGFNIHFHVVAIQDKGSWVDLQIVFAPEREDIFDQIIVQISHLHTVLPVGMIHQKGC